MQRIMRLDDRTTIPPCRLRAAVRNYCHAGAAADAGRALSLHSSEGLILLWSFLAKRADCEWTMISVCARTIAPLSAETTSRILFFGF